MRSRENDDHEMCLSALREENRRVKTLRFLVDLTVQRLFTEPMSSRQALETAANLRETSESLFPGKSGVFDLVIYPRLYRVIVERFGAESVRTHGQ